jgi:hypothetical protein
MSIGGSEVFFRSGGRNARFPYRKLRQTYLAPNEVNLVYIDVLSFICTKYAKEMSIGVSEVFCVLKDEIHI